MPGGISGNVQWNNAGAFAGIAGSAATTLGELLLATPARTTPSLNYYFAVRTPADLALTADTEAVGIQLGGNASLATVARQFTAGGGIALQRECVVVAPTYSATAAESIAEAATFAITGAPIAGTNMTISEAWALLVQSGKSVFIGEMAVTPNARTGSPSIVFQIVTPADTALTASTESILNQFGGSTAQATVIRQWATGALTTQRENVFIAPTYAFVGASTLTTAATVAINAAPIAGTNATITNALALWVQAGLTRFDGQTIVNVSNAAGFAVGPNSNTNPVLRVVTNIASSATGISITGRAAAAGVDLDVLTSGTNEALRVTAAGTGSITLNTYAVFSSLGLIQTRAGVGSTPSTDSISLDGTYFTTVSGADLGAGAQVTLVKTVAANVMGRDGDLLEIRLWGRLQGGNSKNINLRVVNNAQTLNVAVSATNFTSTGYYILIGHLRRDSSTNGEILGYLLRGPAAGGTAIIEGVMASFSGSLDWTGTTAISIVSNNTDANGGTFDRGYIVKHNAP